MTTVDPAAERCKSCSAPILWSTTEHTLKAMPVDAEPVAGGNIAITERAGKRIASVVAPALAFGHRDLHKSHFQTCPNAASHRKRGKA